MNLTAQRMLAPTFKILLKETWEFWKKHIKILTAIVLLPTIIDFISKNHLAKYKDETWMWPTLMILGIVLMVFALALVKTIQSSVRGTANTLIQNLKYGFKRLFSFILLAIRAFLYLFFRGTLLLVIGFLGFFAANNFGIQLGYNEEFIQTVNTVFKILMVIGTLATAILFPRIFAAYFFFVDKNLKGKAALKLSTKLSKGFWWKIASNEILLFILLFIPQILVGFLDKYTFNLVNPVYQLFVVPFSMCFAFLLYEGIRKAKSM